MSTVRTTLLVFICAISIAPARVHTQTAKKAAPADKPAMAKHVAIAPSDIKWGPAPATLPSGAQMAVLDGDPSKAGVPFVIRAKLHSGARGMRALVAAGVSARYAPKVSVPRPGAISNCAGVKPVVGISCVKRACGNVKLHRVVRAGVRYFTVAFIVVLAFNTSR
jgi:hypothetical protein